MSLSSNTVNCTLGVDEWVIRYQRWFLDPVSDKKCWNCRSGSAIKFRVTSSSYDSFLLAVFCIKIYFIILLLIKAVVCNTVNAPGI